MHELHSYPLPGNIRELSNLMARFSALFPGKSICYTDIPAMMLPKGLRDRLLEGTADAPAAKDPPVPAPLASDEIRHNDQLTLDPCNDESEPVHLEAVDVSSLMPAALGPADYNPIEDLIALAQGTPLPALDSIPLKQRIAELEKTLI